MNPFPRIAVGQTIPVPRDVAANVAQHILLAEKAAELRAQVLVFPELSLTGYELESAERLAFVEHDPRLEPLREAAKDTQISLVVGAPFRRETGLHIGALILCPDGGTELVTKQHLGTFSADVNPGGPIPPGEPTVFDAGDRNPMLCIGESRIAFAICADTGRPAHPRAAVDRGATHYLASLFVTPNEVERDAARLRGYAVEHSMTVAMSNYGGPTGGLPAGGSSSIWDDAGELLVRLPSSGAGVAVAAWRDGRWSGAQWMSASMP